jgi:hypothetical protein
MKLGMPSGTLIRKRFACAADADGDASEEKAYLKGQVILPKYWHPVSILFTRIR